MTSFVGAAARPRGLPALTLVLVALNLRPPLTSLGPVLPEAMRDTGMTAVQASLLTTLPVLCMGAFAPLAPGLMRRFGAERVVLAMLVVMGAGAALRGLPRMPALFAGALLAGAAIGVVNVVLPGLVKRDFPDRTPLMMGVYTMALAFGAAAASAVAVPLEQATGFWGWSLACWAGLAAAACLVVAPLARTPARRLPQVVGLEDASAAPPAHAAGLRSPHLAGPEGASAAPPAHAPGLRSPHLVGPEGGSAAASARAPGRSPAPPGDPAQAVPAQAVPAQAVRLWRSPLAWQVSLFMGLQSAMTYTIFGWLAPMLRDRGLPPVQAGLVASVATLVQIFASLAAPVLATRGRDQRAAAVISILLILAGFLGCLLAPLSLVWISAFVMGIGQGAVFAVALTLIVLRAPDARSAGALSSMAQTVGYTLAASGPLLLGALHQWTGGWAVGGGLMALLAAGGAAAGLGAGRALLVNAGHANTPTAPGLPRPR